MSAQLCRDKFRLVIILVIGLGVLDRLPGYAQSMLRRLDPAIQAQLTRIEGKTKRLNILLHGIDSLKNSKPQQALLMAELADSLALSWQKNYQRAQASYWMAWLKFYHGVDITAQPALIDANISLELFKSHSSTYWHARTHTLLASIQLWLKNEDMTKTHFGEAHKALKKLRNQQLDSLQISANLHAVEALFKHKNQIQARQHFQTAISQAIHARDTITAARACQNLGLLYKAEGRYNDAIQTMEQSIHFFTTKPAPGGLRMSLLQLAGLYIDQYQRNPDQGVYFQQALQSLRRALRIEPDFESYFQVGVAYHSVLHNLPFSAPLFKTYSDSAYYYYERAMENAPSCQELENLRQLPLNLERLCNDATYRPGTLQKIGRAHDALWAAEHQARADAQQRLLRFEQERRERQKYRYIRLIAGIALLSGITGLIMYLFSRIRNLSVQLSLSRANLSTHWLSNVLNSIKALVMKGEKQQAAHHISLFHRYCRQVLEDKAPTWNSLDKELTTLCNYLELEKLRMGDRLNYELIVDEQLNPAVVSMPSIIWQSYVENAIWHGLNPKPKGGCIKITFRPINKQRFSMIVEDDGIGIAASKNLKKDTKKTDRSWGIQLAETRMRLLGVKHRVSNVAEDANGQSYGTRVEFLIPIQRYF